MHMYMCSSPCETLGPGMTFSELQFRNEPHMSTYVNVFGWEAFNIDANVVTGVMLRDGALSKCTNWIWVGM